MYPIPFGNHESSNYVEVAAVSIGENTFCPTVFSSIGAYSFLLAPRRHTGFRQAQNFSRFRPSATRLGAGFGQEASGPVGLPLLCHPAPHSPSSLDGDKLYDPSPGSNTTSNVSNEVLLIARRRSLH